MLRVATEKGFKWNYEIPSSRVVLGCSFSLPIFPSPVLQDAKDVDWCNHQQRAQHEPSFAPNPEGGSQAVWAWGAQISPCWITKLQLTPNRCWKHQFRRSLARDKWDKWNTTPKFCLRISGTWAGDNWETNGRKVQSHAAHSTRSMLGDKGERQVQSHAAHSTRSMLGDKGERQVQSHAAHSTRSMLGDKGERQVQSNAPQSTHSILESIHLGTQARRHKQNHEAHTTNRGCGENTPTTLNI